MPAVEKVVQFGEYGVSLISEEVLEGFTIRTLNVYFNKVAMPVALTFPVENLHFLQKAHQVTQFHITCWSPSGQCSNLRCVVDVIEEVAKVQRRTGNKPVFVHCRY